MTSELRRESALPINGMTSQRRRERALPVDGALADEVEHHERDGAGDAQQDDGHGDGVELECSLAARVVRLYAPSHRVRICSKTRHTTVSDTSLLYVTPNLTFCHHTVSQVHFTLCDVLI